MGEQRGRRRRLSRSRSLSRGVAAQVLSFWASSAAALRDEAPYDRAECRTERRLGVPTPAASVIVIRHKRGTGRAIRAALFTAGGKRHCVARERVL
jgi:hypothetical protein